MAKASWPCRKCRRPLGSDAFTTELDFFDPQVQALSVLATCPHCGHRIMALLTQHKFMDVDDPHDATVYPATHQGTPA